MKLPDLTYLVGIVGKKGSGKDTLADYLVNKFSFNKLSFATKVKELGEDLFTVVSKDEEGRHIFQQIGGLMRTIRNTVWIDYLFRKIEEIRFEFLHILNPPKIVISDVRYLNEAERVIKEKGILIVLDVDSETRRRRNSKRDKRKISKEAWDKAEQHGSETGVDDIIEHFVEHENCVVLDGKQFHTKEKVFSIVKEILNLKEK